MLTLRLDGSLQLMMLKMRLRIAKVSRPLLQLNLRVVNNNQVDKGHLKEGREVSNNNKVGHLKEDREVLHLKAVRVVVEGNLHLVICSQATNKVELVRDLHHQTEVVVVCRILLL